MSAGKVAVAATAAASVAAVVVVDRAASEGKELAVVAAERSRARDGFRVSGVGMGPRVAERLWGGMYAPLGDT